MRVVRCEWGPMRCENFDVRWGAVHYGKFFDICTYITKAIFFFKSHFKNPLKTLTSYLVEAGI